MFSVLESGSCHLSMPRGTDQVDGNGNLRVAQYRLQGADGFGMVASSERGHPLSILVEDANDLCLRQLPQRLPVVFGHLAAADENQRHRATNRRCRRAGSGMSVDMLAWDIGVASWGVLGLCRVLAGGQPALESGVRRPPGRGCSCRPTVGRLPRGFGANHRFTRRGRRCSRSVADPAASESVRGSTRSSRWLVVRDCWDAEGSDDGARTPHAIQDQGRSKPSSTDRLLK